jgi:outer membrane protein
MKHLIIGGMAAILVAGMVQEVIAAEPFKVAIIDQQAVIERSAAGKRALEEMKSYSVTRQRIVEADDQELKELEKAAQDATLSEEAKKEKQDLFRTKLEAYQRRIQEFNREVQEKQRAMIAEYSKKIRDAASVIAQKEGYTAVIDKGNEGAVKIVMYHNPSVDLTDKVVKELDRQNK